MSNVEEFPLSARKLTEFEALVAAAPGALEAIPGAVYVCDSEGGLVTYNREAAELWGRTPELGSVEKFCGSHRLYRMDGTVLPHSECPMANAVRLGLPTRNTEVTIEQPNGSRITALVNIRPLRDHAGRIQGAINCFQDVSDRKKIEEEVRAKTKDLEDFFENSAVGLHIVGGDGIIRRANQAELDLLGYSAEEYIGHHVAEFHADAPVIGDILHRLSCGERLDRYPARLRAKDGSIKHVLITSNSRVEDGKFVSTRCFTTDVTGLRVAELAREASETRLAATYQAAKVGIAEADEHGRLLRVNDYLSEITGRSREELLGMSFSDYTHPDDCAADLALYEQQVRGEIRSYTCRKRALRPDGSVRYLEIFSSSVTDSAGRFRYGVRVSHDVTEAKRLQDRIRESEQHMRDLLEALPAALYTTDANGRITFYNKTAVEMAGRTPLPGDEWCVTWKLYWPDGTPLPHDQCPMAIALREGRPVRGVEAVAERPDGTRVPFIPYPTPLFDSGGRLIGAVNMLVDITERKRAEMAQTLLIDELNHRVKNTLAMVQSLAGQTARHTSSLDDFNRTFEGRLLALSRAHDLLTERKWQDAPLQRLVEDITAAVAEDGRIRMEGPPVALNARSALSFTMVLNELLTNATKYGALSAPDGTLLMRWSLRNAGHGTILDYEWVESGGPKVTPPMRRGFGTRLMERCVEADLGGEFDLAFEPGGVRCRMSMPVTGTVGSN